MLRCINTNLICLFVWLFVWLLILILCSQMATISLHIVVWVFLDNWPQNKKLRQSIWSVHCNSVNVFVMSKSNSINIKHKHHVRTWLWSPGCRGQTCVFVVCFRHHCCQRTSWPRHPAVCPDRGWQCGNVVSEVWNTKPASQIPPFFNLLKSCSLKFVNLPKWGTGTDQRKYVATPNSLN